MKEDGSPVNSEEVQQQKFEAWRDETYPNRRARGGRLSGSQHLAEEGRAPTFDEFMAKGE